MTCEHLRELEAEMISVGLRETFRGAAWSEGCREWVYFDCWLDRPSIRRRLALADCVHDHDHLGTHSGQEAGFVCIRCNDAIMGVHKSHFKRGTPVHR
jgi:hypothetical protein